MMYRFDSVKEWIETLEKNPKLESLPFSVVASYLEISRTAVANLVKRERLEEVRIYDKGELISIMITMSSVKNFEKTKILITFI